MANRYLELEAALRTQARTREPADDVGRPVSSSLRSRRRAATFSVFRGGLRTRAFTVVLPGSVLDRTKRLEGSISWMYLDTAGKVTIGVGRMLPSADQAAALPFVRNSGGAATEQEKRAEFATVLGKEKGKHAAYYKPFTTLTLPQADIDSLLTTDLEHVVTRLTARLPDYNKYPTTVQEALVDMMFNLGESGLMDGFPKFIAAVNANDWKTAAAESKRRGVALSRNDEIRDLILAAAAP